MSKGVKEFLYECFSENGRGSSKRVLACIMITVVLGVLITFSITDGCTENGYALHCCNCGHLDIFSLDGNSIDSALGIGNKLKERNIRCGIKPEEIGKCYLKECPFRKNIENKKGEEK